MPRPRSIIPRDQYLVRLPTDLYARVVAHLYSPAEQCVPYGAWSAFVEDCIRDRFRKLDDQK